MHVNKTKFEKNGSQEYHHMTYIGKTEHANQRGLLSLANSNPHEVLSLVLARDYRPVRALNWTLCLLNIYEI